MMAIAAANAALNLVCLRLLRRHRGEDVNFKASAIFTNNDSIVNGSIVLSGALVMWLGSNIPDLLLGVVVAAIAANGGAKYCGKHQKPFRNDFGFYGHYAAGYASSLEATY